MNRVSKRRFTCEKCGKKTFDDDVKLGAMNKLAQEHGVKIETEFIDLCEKCFRQEVKNYAQTSVISKGIADKKITEDDLIQLSQNPKYKNVIFKKLENKKGHMKEKRKLLIQSLLNKSGN